MLQLLYNRFVLLVQKCNIYKSHRDKDSHPNPLLRMFAQDWSNRFHLHGSIAKGFPDMFFGLVQ